MKEIKLLERRQPLNLLKRLCALLIKKIIMLKILPGEEVVEEEEEDISEAGGQKTDTRSYNTKSNFGSWL